MNLSSLNMNSSFYKNKSISFSSKKKTKIPATENQGDFFISKQQRDLPEYKIFLNTMLKTYLLGIGMLCPYGSNVNPKVFENYYKTKCIYDKAFCMPNEISEDIGWNKNTRVLASTSQKTFSYSICDSTYTNNYYLDAVFTNLRMPEVKTIEQATQMVITNDEVNIYRSMFDEKPAFQYPVETPGNLGIYNKDQKDKRRVVILIPGEEKRFKNKLKDVKESLKFIYGLKDKNFQTVYDKKELGIVFNKIKKLSKKSKDDVEILFVANLHGGTIGKSYRDYIIEADKVKEGDYVGIWENGISENYLKEFIGKLPENCKNLILQSSCFSGAWVADNMKQEPKEKCDKA